jgi:CotH protein
MFPRGLMLLLAAGCGATAHAPGLPAARAIPPDQLPDALFDDNPESFPEIRVEVTQEEWDVFCRNGILEAYSLTADPPQPYTNKWARVKFTLGDEELDDVGMRFMGRGTVQNLFCPQGPKVRECHTVWFDRCRAALADDSTRYDPSTGLGQLLIKPSFKFDFAKFASGRKFHGLKKLNVAGDTGWLTALDEWLPFALYARAGVAGVRVGHVALYINGTYRGLYFVEEQVDQKAWLDYHFPGLDPAGDGAYFKIDGQGNETYFSDNPADYVTNNGNPLYEPVAGSTNQDLADLIATFKVLDVDTLHDEEAFKREAEQRLDVGQWLTEMAMEMAMGDIDGVYSNRNNHMIVRRADGKYEPVRYDPDQSFYGWLNERDPKWHDWPGLSAERGTSLMCLRPTYDNAMPNCPDGSAPESPTNPGHTVGSARHPVIAARVMQAYREDFFDKVDELLDGVLNKDDVLALLDARAALIQPWIGNAGEAHLDPWSTGYYGWRFNVYGGADADPATDCREVQTDSTKQCQYRQMVEFYLEQAAKQVAAIRAGTMPGGCPQDPPDNPSYTGGIVPCD